MKDIFTEKQEQVFEKFMKLKGFKSLLAVNTIDVLFTAQKIEESEKDKEC